jgi:hypothetical protein
MSFLVSRYRAEILRAMGLLPVIAAGGLAGCAEEGAAGEPYELAVDAAAPPLVMQLPAAMLAGQTVQVQVSGATPNATVFLAAANAPGAGPCPPALGGLCIDLDNPRVLGRALASGAGRATFDVLLPHDMPEGSTIYLQAAQGGAQAAKTNVASDLIEYPRRTCGDWEWLDDTNYANLFEVFACAPLPAGGACPAPAAITYPQWDWVFEYNTGVPAQQPWGGYSLYGDCYEASVEDACCYHAYISGFAVGRPFEIDGRPRLAEDSCDTSWCAELELDLSGLSGAARRRVAWAWKRTAFGEHASVAAFARFVLQLTHVGAPAALVAEATRAMADEIRHARDAFAIASALADEAVGAGALDASGALSGLDLASIVRATVREGCVAETISAAQAAIARDACVEPTIRAVLDGVAADEQRHATLAWRFVRWAVERDASMRAVVADELARGFEVPTLAADAHADALRAYGALSEPEMYAIGRRVFDDVVLPCARALLGEREVGAIV